MKFFAVCILALAASVSAHHEVEAAVEVELKNNNPLLGLFENIGNVIEDGQEFFSNVHDSVSDLFEEIKEDATTDGILSSILKNVGELIDTITEDIKEVAANAAKTAEELVAKAKVQSNEFIDSVSEKCDEITNQVDNASKKKDDDDDSIGDCIDAGKEEGVVLVKSLANKTLDCALSKLTSVTTKVHQLIETPAQAIDLVESSIKELKACKESTANTFDKVTCLSTTSISIKAKGAAFVAKTVGLVATTSTEVATMKENLLGCLVTNFASSAWPLLNIVGKIGTCSAMAFLSG